MKDLILRTLIKTCNNVRFMQCVKKKKYLIYYFKDVISRAEVFFTTSFTTKIK